MNEVSKSWEQMQEVARGLSMRGYVAEACRLREQWAANYHRMLAEEAGIKAADVREVKIK